VINACAATALLKLHPAEACGSNRLTLLFLLQLQFRQRGIQRLVIHPLLLAQITLHLVLADARALLRFPFLIRAQLLAIAACADEDSSLALASQLEALHAIRTAALLQ